MSAGALAVSFFDPARQLYGTARSGTTLLFDGTTPRALPEGPAVERRGEGVRAELEGRFALELEPVAAVADLDGVAVRECLGTLSETRRPPAWEQLDALRSVSALLDEGHAVLALARRPRGALGHGHERVVAWILQAGELLAVEEARLSTVYDGDGRQRSAGLELWLPGEDFPRRGSGTVVAGSSLELEGLRVNAAVFRWRMDEREGYGAYEVMVRREAPAAA